jgi:hypothetical protein
VQRRGCPVRYGPTVIGPPRQIWEAAGYPWSVRPRALLPTWLPWATRRWKIPRAVVDALPTMSPRQMERALRSFKKELRKRQYGRTKPGTLLKHQIPLKTDRLVRVPGFTEIDLVAHSGDRAEGDFLHSLNVTDIHHMGGNARRHGEEPTALQTALEHIRQQLPFRLQGSDSDNGSEFINNLLRRYCTAQQIQFTRGPPVQERRRRAHRAEEPDARAEAHRLCAVRLGSGAVGHEPALRRPAAAAEPVSTFGEADREAPHRRAHSPAL